MFTMPLINVNTPMAVTMPGLEAPGSRWDSELFMAYLLTK
jgi:hypothetical protein